MLLNRTNDYFGVPYRTESPVAAGIIVQMAVNLDAVDFGHHGTIPLRQYLRKSSYRGGVIVARY